MADQLSILPMDEILNPKPENIKKTVKEAVKEVIKEEPAQVETKDPVEAQLSIRKRHRDKEQDAQGRARNPDTGQYAAKQQEEEKPEVKAEVKEEKKDEKKEEIQQVKQEEKKPAAAQEFTDKERAFLRAAEEERRKRQELERRLADLEKAKETPKEASGEPAKTFWDDPEGSLKANMGQLREEVSRQVTASRLNTSEMIARSRYQDFDDKIKAFGEIMQKTPGLYQQFITNPDPGEFAYQLAKQHMEFQEVGSIPALRAKIEKETRLKLEEELKQKAEALAKEKAAIPPSITEAPSKGQNRRVFSGPTSMDDILHG